MATKVYRDGNNIIVIQADLLVNKIPLNSFSFSVSETTGAVLLIDSAGPIFKDKGPNLQNSQGQRIGSLGQIKFYLELISNGFIAAVLQAISNVTQSVVSGANGNVVLFENAITQDGISINAGTGVITFLVSKNYSLLVALNLDRISGTPIVELWLEYFDIIWILVPNSGRIKEYNNSNEFYCIFEIPLTVDVSTITDYRVKVRELIGNCQLFATALANGISVPSCTISIYR